VGVVCAHGGYGGCNGPFGIGFNFTHLLRDRGKAGISALPLFGFEVLKS
jgi:hypothetical protein